MDLTTLARVKAWGGFTTTQHDALMSSLITAVSAEAEKFLNRHVEQLARTEQFDVKRGIQHIFLPGFPVLAAPALQVRNNQSRDFTGAAIAVTNNYFLDLRRGIIKFDRYELVTGPGVVQVIYTGGMATSVAAFIAAYPNLANAVDMQISFMVRRRDSFGTVSFNAEGGSISLEAPLEWINPARTALNDERRLAES